MQCTGLLPSSKLDVVLIFHVVMLTTMPSFKAACLV